MWCIKGVQRTDPGERGVFLGEVTFEMGPQRLEDAERRSGRDKGMSEKGRKERGWGRRWELGFFKIQDSAHLGQAAIPVLDTCAWPVPQCVPRCPLAVEKG